MGERDEWVKSWEQVGHDGTVVLVMVMSLLL
jgi:hypothetical protein